MNDSFTSSDDRKESFMSSKAGSAGWGFQGDAPKVAFGALDATNATLGAPALSPNGAVNAESGLAGLGRPG
ncbi:hypothetical protein ABJI51_14170 [Amycolatopsis sp. NEAU-NG30]|uniref:Uncharacterized protein n=1 Tax=Amycolatopsis melonis TaxID=3156488 RepID=A0ABV0LD78_9PSEU